MVSKLGEMLVKAQLITDAQLDEVMKIQRREGGKLGSIVVRSGFCSDQDIVSFLGMQYGVPAADLEQWPPIDASVRNGDPTPFKRFRRQEFISTMEHMGNMPDSATVTELLENEITITEEVYQLAMWLKERGCAILCLSDKPDEASRPHARVSPDLVPLHRAVTHRVGTDIRPVLASI